MAGRAGRQVTIEVDEELRRRFEKLPLKGSTAHRKRLPPDQEQAFIYAWEHYLQEAVAPEFGMSPNTARALYRELKAKKGD
jgi:hypothetical protein